MPEWEVRLIEHLHNLLTSHTAIVTLLTTVLISVFLLWAVSRFGNLSSLLDQLSNSLLVAKESCKDFLAGEKRWVGLIGSICRPLCYLGIALVVLLSSLSPHAPREAPAQYLVSSDDDLLLVRLHLHFDNAELQDGELTERGIELRVAQKATLEATMKTLECCAEGGRRVTITPYGFASEDPFRALPKHDSRALNLEVANRRAKAAYAALNTLASDFSGVTINQPKRWIDFETMEGGRSKMIPVPDNSERDSFGDRVVVLYLLNSGSCVVVQNEPQ